MPNACGAFSAAAATNTAARPTSEWNAATSCGSAVIWICMRDEGADAAADDDAEHDQRRPAGAHAMMDERHA